MNRIQTLFNNKKQNILSIYFTAGYPNLNDTVQIIQLLESKGADMIEIGFPFSDPIADGTVIQNSSYQALQNGMNLTVLFQQLKDIRKSTQIPLILMGYLNPVIQMGFEKFCKNCQETGIDGIIIPDLPLDVYIEEYEQITKRYGIENISLVTPDTSNERISLIDKHSNAFIYMVSAASTTGAKDKFSDEQVAYFKRISSLKLNNPLMIGFGISNQATLTAACSNASGAIIGSAFVKSLKANDLENSVANFFELLKS
jgi:tryptophan synthase alpha chain